MGFFCVCIFSAIFYAQTVEWVLLSKTYTENFPETKWPSYEGINSPSKKKLFIF